MVGTVGALKSGPMPYREAMRAMDLASTFTAGWPKNDREGIEQTIAAFREVVEHNETVYKQASEALSEMSKREAKLRKDSDAFDADRAASNEALSRRSDEIAKARATLDEERETFDAERDGFKTARKATEDGHVETAKAQEAKQRELDDREKRIEAVELVTNRDRSEASALLAKVKEAARKVQEAVRGL